MTDDEHVELRAIASRAFVRVVIMPDAVPDMVTLKAYVKMNVGEINVYPLHSGDVPKVKSVWQGHASGWLVTAAGNGWVTRDPECVDAIYDLHFENEMERPR